jgi:hypothetical protein
MDKDALSGGNGNVKVTRRVVVVLLDFLAGGSDNG